MKQNHRVIFKISIVAGILLSQPVFSQKAKSPVPLSDLRSFEKALALIPGATFMAGICDSDLSYIPLKKCRLVNLDTFYMSKYEVSNGQYLEFLYDLSLTDTAAYRRMLPDTLVWRSQQMRRYGSEIDVEYYLRHPVYRNHPVVGISYDQATAFCNWLTKTYRNKPERKYKEVSFQLPTEEQWEYAAKGKISLAPFPWGTSDFQNEKGEWFANFTMVPKSSVYRDNLYIRTFSGYEKKEQRIGGQERVTGSLQNPYLGVLAPVKFYEPNGYGLYNMAGNAEELVMERGITKGGSWYDTGAYLQIYMFEKHDAEHETSPERGFRFIMIVKK